MLPLTQTSASLLAAYLNKQPGIRATNVENANEQRVLYTFQSPYGPVQRTLRRLDMHLITMDVRLTRRYNAPQAAQAAQAVAQ